MSICLQLSCSEAEVLVVIFSRISEDDDLKKRVLENLNPYTMDAVTIQLKKELAGIYSKENWDDT